MAKTYIEENQANFKFEVYSGVDLLKDFNKLTDAKKYIKKIKRRKK